MTLLPIWGVRSGMSERLAAATLSAVYLGSIALQVLIGWLSDRLSRDGGAPVVWRGRPDGRNPCCGVPASPPALFGRCSFGAGSRRGSIRWRSAWPATGSAAANWSR